MGKLLLLHEKMRRVVLLPILVGTILLLGSSAQAGDGLLFILEPDTVVEVDL